MKKILAACALLVACTTATADFEFDPTGDPANGGSWSQAFVAWGQGLSMFAARVNVGSFSPAYMTDLTAGTFGANPPTDWNSVVTGDDVVIAQGSALTSLDFLAFEMHFEGTYQTTAVEFEIIGFIGDEAAGNYVFSWNPDLQRWYWSWGNWDIDADSLYDAYDQAVMVPVPAALPLGLAGLVGMVAFRRRMPAI